MNCILRCSRVCTVTSNILGSVLSPTSVLSASKPPIFPTPDRSSGGFKVKSQSVKKPEKCVGTS